MKPAFNLETWSSRRSDTCPVSHMEKGKISSFPLRRHQVRSPVGTQMNIPSSGRIRLFAPVLLDGRCRSLSNEAGEHGATWRTNEEEKGKDERADLCDLRVRRSLTTRRRSGVFLWIWQLFKELAFTHPTHQVRTGGHQEHNGVPNHGDLMDSQRELLGGRCFLPRGTPLTVAR